MPWPLCLCHMCHVVRAGKGSVLAETKKRGSNPPSNNFSREIEVEHEHSCLLRGHVLVCVTFQNNLLRKNFSKKIMFKLMFFYRIIKNIVNDNDFKFFQNIKISDYNFRFKVKTVIGIYSLKFFLNRSHQS